MLTTSNAQLNCFVIVKNGRPVRLENSCVDGGYLVFATVQEAKDYGAVEAEIFIAKDFGIESTPNVRAVNVTEDSCDFQFKYNNRWQ